MGRSSAHAGQATVEAALTLPLAIFLVLGGLQVFLTLQARLMAQYAVARAAHVGASNFGDCDRMTHAAILGVLPTFVSFIGPTQAGATPEEKLANAFSLRRANRYAGSGNVGDGSYDDGYNGPVVWIYRETPLAKDVRATATGQDEAFDLPGSAKRLEIRMVYWYPMHIPFANWVLARATLAQWGVEDYVATNPLMPTQTARWQGNNGFSPSTDIKNEMRARAAMKQWVLPISVSYTTRMMTPSDIRYFATQNCPPVP